MIITPQTFGEFCYSKAMKFKIILFDAVGVLFPANTVVGDDLARRFGLSNEELLKMWKGFYPAYTVGNLTTEEFLDTFAQTYNIPRFEITEAVFTESFKKSLSPMPGMEGILKKLSDTGIKIAMLSDTAEMFADARRTWLFSEYFDHIFMSFEIGYKKPDPHAYQTVIDYYAVQPKQIFFIDDIAGNVDAAKQLGLDGAVFTDSEQLARDLQQAGILD